MASPVGPSPVNAARTTMLQSDLGIADDVLRLIDRC
jgi:hypothetical protein